MKKKTILIITLALFFIVFIVGYRLFIMQVDTKYAIKFSEVFQTYDIEVIDTFLLKDTKIISNGKQATYNELRDNVVKACDEKIYEFSSYGHGNDKFVNGVQDVNIYLPAGNLNGDDFGDIDIKMKLRKNGLFSFSVDSIESDEPLFQYLFFGKNVNNGN